MVNTVDPDHTALLGAVWSGSVLFVQTYLSQYLEFLWKVMTSICSEIYKCSGCFTDVDSVLLRMTIIGVLLSFRNLAQEALNDVS